VRVECSDQHQGLVQQGRDPVVVNGDAVLKNRSKSFLFYFVVSFNKNNFSEKKIMRFSDFGKTFL
jgi:hypothetical protein